MSKSLKRYAALFGVVAFGVGLIALPISLAAAAPLPEEPLTEVCGGPPTPGDQALCGTLNPSSNSKVGYFFAYNTGASCQGGQQTTAGAEVQGEGIKVTADLTGLAPSTQYAYCLVAVNESGSTYGRPVIFRTDPGASSGPISFTAPTSIPGTYPAVTAPLNPPAAKPPRLSEALKRCKQRHGRSRIRCVARTRSRFGGHS